MGGDFLGKKCGRIYKKVGCISIGIDQEDHNGRTDMLGVK